jgi:hypothetical protein
MGTKEKKFLLMRFFWLNVHCGYDFSFYMGKPLSFYNFEELKKSIEKLEIEYNNQ